MGLVDCSSENEFQLKSEKLKPVWQSQHPNGKEFLEHFTQHKAQDILNCMFLIMYHVHPSCIACFDLYIQGRSQDLL